MYLMEGYCLQADLLPNRSLVCSELKNFFLEPTSQDRETLTMFSQNWGKRRSRRLAPIDGRQRCRAEHQLRRDAVNPPEVSCLGLDQAVERLVPLTVLGAQLWGRHKMRAFRLRLQREPTELSRVPSRARGHNQPPYASRRQRSRGDKRAWT
jgi:hypothetical protein